MLKIIRKTGYLFVNFLVYLAGFFVFRSRKYILIGGWFGQFYGDNSKHLFEYLSQKSSGYKKIVFYTRNKDIYRALSSNGFFCVYGHSGKAVFWHLKCGIHVIDNSFYTDIMSLLSSGAFRVYLSHGVGFKDVGNYVENGAFPKQSFLNKITSRGCWRDCYYVATSEFQKKQIIDFYNADPQKIVISSMIRDDNLNKKQSDSSDSHFNILYLPTFRGKSSRNPLLDENLDEINRFLASHDLFFYAKPHRAEKAVWPSAHFPNFSILDSSVDIYELPFRVDLVISDYSSGIYDFLLFNVPVLSFPFDLESYLSSERKTYWPYFDTCPGQVVRTFRELSSLILDIKNSPKAYSDKNSSKSSSIRSLLFGSKSEIDFTPLLKLLSPSKKELHIFLSTLNS